MASTAITTTPTRVTAADVAGLLQRASRSGVPKYTALRDAVVQAVASGRLAPGDRLPNEQELADVLPISLGTIQRALRQLVEEGVVQRRHGQGSFITGRTRDAEMSHPFHCRFLDDSGQGYLKVFPEAMGRRKLTSAGEWSQVLRATEGIEITRRIHIGTEFTVFSTFIVDAQRMPLFSSTALKQLGSENFKDVIFRALGRMIQRVDIFLSVRGAPPEAAGVMGLPAGAPCMALRAIAYLSDGDPIYYQHIYIPPNDRELHVITDARASGLL